MAPAARLCWRACFLDSPAACSWAWRNERVRRSSNWDTPELFNELMPERDEPAQPCGGSRQALGQATAAAFLGDYPADTAALAAASGKGWLRSAWSAVMRPYRGSVLNRLLACRHGIYIRWRWRKGGLDVPVLVTADQEVAESCSRLGVFARHRLQKLTCTGPLRSAKPGSARQASTALSSTKAQPPPVPASRAWGHPAETSMRRPTASHAAERRRPQQSEGPQGAGALISSPSEAPRQRPHQAPSSGRPQAGPQQANNPPPGPGPHRCRPQRVACRRAAPQTTPEGNRPPAQQQIKWRSDLWPGVWPNPTLYVSEPGPEGQERSSGRTGSRVPGCQPAWISSRPRRAGRCARAPGREGRSRQRRARRSLADRLRGLASLFGCGKAQAASWCIPLQASIAQKKKKKKKRAVLTAPVFERVEAVIYRFPVISLRGCSQSGPRAATDLGRASFIVDGDGAGPERCGWLDGGPRGPWG